MIMHDIQNFDVKPVSKKISTADYPQHIQLAHILLAQKYSRIVSAGLLDHPAAKGIAGSTSGGCSQ